MTETYIFLQSQIVSIAPKALGALIVFFVFWLVSRVAIQILTRIGARLDKTILNLLCQTVKSLFILFGLITALGTLGIDVSALVAGLGLTGFALGFALKDIISNVLSGVLIFIYRPFKVNDKVVIDKYEGHIKSIDLRYTKILQNDREILIPNSHVFTRPVVLLREP